MKFDVAKKLQMGKSVVLARRGEIISTSTYEDALVVSEAMPISTVTGRQDGKRIVVRVIFTQE